MILHYSLPILNNNDNALSLLLFSNAQGLVTTLYFEMVWYYYSLAGIKKSSLTTRVNNNILQKSIFELSVRYA